MRRGSSTTLKNACTEWYAIQDSVNVYKMCLVEWPFKYVARNSINVLLLLNFPKAWTGLFYHLAFEYLSAAVYKQNIYTAVFNFILVILF